MAGCWIEPLRGRPSRGSSAPRPGSLAGLAAARALHVGQFWTPDAAAALLWRIAGQAMEGVARRVHLLDTSVGVGRLLQFADPARHTVAGVDVDGELIEGLSAAAEAAGFQADFLCAGLEEVSPSGFDCCLLNPAFGLTLSAPNMEPFSCTTWGAYGPNTSARSHAYAVLQAAEAAPVVVAIVPATYAADVARETPPELVGRLRAILELPAGTFREESTDVAVSVLVIGPIDGGEPLRLRLPTLDAQLPSLRLAGALASATRPRPLARAEDAARHPTIVGPVTGDPTVRVVHHGRWIRLQCPCALTRAKVLNAVLRRPVLPIEGHRYPESVQYAGQGRLDVEVLLLQEDPQAAFDELLREVAAAGGAPIVDPTLAGYLRRRIRRHRRQAQPFGHWVRDGLQNGQLQAVARRKRLLDPSVWGSPVIGQGDRVGVERDAAGRYVLCLGQARAAIEERDLLQDFDLPPAGAEWRAAHRSRAEAFPALASAIRKQLDACGAAAVASWGYQLEDLVEVELGRNGYLAWRPGCGKGRAAIALCHMPGKHHAIVVESHLVDTLLVQLRESNVDPALWQVIRTPAQCRALRKINIISYETLRRPICAGAGRRTYARLLRRRFCRVVADEAQLLRHLNTAQTRAVWMLSPRRRIAMSGTPLPNYVQDLLPAMQWVYGDATAIQPYGSRRRPYLTASMFRTMDAATRGVDAFSDHYVVTEWVTREFKEGLEEGAKRQVPRINNLPLLRRWAAPLLKRRLESEPMVAQHFKAVQPIIREVPIDWDPAHLAHYLRVADEFRHWYQEELRRANDAGRPMNIVVLLARIAAVTKACSLPQYHSDSAVFRSVPGYGALTSKQRYVLDRLGQWVEEGHKAICYVDSPQAVNLYTRHLERAGIDAVAFHGEMPIARRNAELRQRFTEGTAPVLVASIQTIERGHNLYCASRGIFACRSWRGDTEEQGARRMCRPQQTAQVLIEKPNLRGSIDEYQAQMTAMKVEAAAAAQDFMTPADPQRQFQHLDMILSRFVQNLASLHGTDPQQLREDLKNAA